jgi:hypothetical protein
VGVADEVELVATWLDVGSAKVWEDELEVVWMFAAREEVLDDWL